MPAIWKPDPRQNHLLALLADDVLDRLAPHLESVPLTLGDILFEPGTRAQYVVFPTDGIVSLLFVMRDGATAEIAVVGSEGLVGVAALLGGESWPSRTMVQVSGSGFRIPADVVADELARNNSFQQVTMRFVQVLMTQMAQTAVCNRHHVVEKQLCRWLLMCLDRLGERRLAMTQELIATMLGVRREGVTVAAQKLQALGIIRYTRGMIEVLDRTRLEQRACECYGVVRAEFERLLPRPQPVVRGVA